MCRKPNQTELNQIKTCFIWRKKLLCSNNSLKRKKKKKTKTKNSSEFFFFWGLILFVWTNKIHQRRKKNVSFVYLLPGKVQERNEVFSIGARKNVDNSNLTLLGCTPIRRLLLVFQHLQSESRCYRNHIFVLCFIASIVSQLFMQGIIFFWIQEFMTIVDIFIVSLSPSYLTARDTPNFSFFCFI